MSARALPHRHASTTAAREGRQVRSEAGSMSVELVLLTPALVACILLIAAGARVVSARGETTDAAYAAARAGSLATSPDTAQAAAGAAASRSLALRGRSCSSVNVRVDTSAFGPGGQVRATVSCTTDLADLSGLGLPGHHVFIATAVVPLEQHRDFS